MWIIPNNHSLYYQFAPDYLASKEDLKDLAQTPASLPMWRAKPLLLPTYLRVWNRVYWLQHLFGRTLKPCHHQRFETKYSALLEDIHANPFPLPDNEKENKTLDTFGRIYKALSKQLDLFVASSKMLTTTSPWDSTLFTKTYQQWITKLRQEYLVREKLALRTSAKDYSYWPTPMAQDTGGTTREDFSLTLSQKVKQENWSTPAAQNYKDPCHHGTGKPNLQTMTREYQ
jgi:hypothetical protein